jgi:hypothetical protein
MPIIKEEEVLQLEEQVDELVLKVFLKALDIVGGPRKLILYRHLTWVPSLIGGLLCGCIEGKIFQDGIGNSEHPWFDKATVRNILTAKTEGIRKILRPNLRKRR